MIIDINLDGVDVYPRGAEPRREEKPCPGQRTKWSWSLLPRAELSAPSFPGISQHSFLCPSSIVGPHLFLFLSQSSFQIQLQQTYRHSCLFNPPNWRSWQVPPYLFLFGVSFWFLFGFCFVFLFFETEFLCGALTFLELAL